MTDGKPTVHYTTSEPPGEFPIIGDTPIPGTRQLPNIAWTKDEAHARRLVLAWNSLDELVSLVERALRGKFEIRDWNADARAILAKVKKEQEAG